MTGWVRAALAAGVVVCAGTASAETPLERGTYLMNSIVACGNCHTPQGPNGPIEGMELAGMAPLHVEEGLFVANAPNITQDEETGIGSWSDDEIKLAIREGVRPDGTIIGPPMPIMLYRSMSDDDLDAIVAYLRTVKPVKNEIPASEYNIPLPPSYGAPVAKVAAPSPDDQVAWGAYLAGPLGHCIECHTPMTPQGPDMSQLGAGGMEFHGPWGTSVSANITPTGLADYTDDEIIQIVTTGTRPNGEKMMPPMGYGYYANMSEQDLRAIVAYLRTLEPK